MTYADWNARILTYLDVDATRRGIEPLRASYIKAALADLKHFVPCLVDNATTYADTDEVPMDETAAEAVAMYIKSKLARGTEKDLGLQASFWSDYVGLRRRLVRECNERREVVQESVLLTAVYGNSFEFQINLKLGNNVIDPTGKQVWFTVKRDLEDDDACAILTKSTEVTVDEPVPAITILVAGQGKLLVSLTPTDTKKMEAGRMFYFDVDLVDGTNEYTVLSGRITMKQAVRNL